MDIISHGLYGGIAFGRTSTFSYLKAFFFGVMPDLFSFGILFTLSALRIVSGPDFGDGPPDPSAIPAYVHRLYNVTHSLVIAGMVIGIVWVVRGKPMMELFAWPLHILVDIPTHSSRFFPTPFLWPVTDFTINGIPWSRPYIFIPNLILLAMLYLWLFKVNRKTLTSVK
jgi:hypothetical protein